MPAFHSMHGRIYEGTVRPKSRRRQAYARVRPARPCGGGPRTEVGGEERALAPRVRRGEQGWVRDGSAVDAEGGRLGGRELEELGLEREDAAERVRGDAGVNVCSRRQKSGAASCGSVGARLTRWAQFAVEKAHRG